MEPLQTVNIEDILWMEQIAGKTGNHSENRLNLTLLFNGFVILQRRHIAHGDDVAFFSARNESERRHYRTTDF